MVLSRPIRDNTIPYLHQLLNMVLSLLTQEVTTGYSLKNVCLQTLMLVSDRRDKTWPGILSHCWLQQELCTFWCAGLLNFWFSLSPTTSWFCFILQDHTHWQQCHLNMYEGAQSFKNVWKGCSFTTLCNYSNFTMRTLVPRRPCYDWSWALCAG